MRTKVRGSGAGLLLVVALVPTAWAQTSQGTSFTYQGRLTEAGGLANGSYDFQFVLYDAPVGGVQVGPAVALEDVTVTAGLFTAGLDFGLVFGGEKRWLELGVRLGADPGPYTPILPRQELTPGPSALFSAAAGDALELGGVAASQYVQTDDPRLSDARDPLPGSPAYVQNGSAQQAGVSFNVGGTGTASVLDAATQFNLGGNRILGNPGTNNLFAGANAGASNTTGVANAFFGAEAGFANTTGGSNSFFGFNAGRSTTTSHNNSFFGDAAGFFNTTGEGGSFFGFLAGFNNTTGNLNSFFGEYAGSDNTTGFANAFFGDSAGGGNTTGAVNAFFGRNAGLANTTGSFNAFFGENAGTFNDTGFASTYIGRDAGHFSTGGNNVFIGFGTGAANTTGNNNTLLGYVANVGAPTLSFATAIGAGAVVGTSNTVVLGRSADAVQVPGSMTVAGTFGASLAGGGTATLCRNPSNEIAFCSSSLRYKTEVQPFRGGLELVKRLQPIRFTWKTSGKRDVGLGAEDVARVEPLLTFRNDDDEIEGVNYSQLSVVLVNAVKQQQEQLMRQQQEIDALKALFCQANPEAGYCLEVAAPED